MTDATLSMPPGYHIYVAVPGSVSHDLWFLAGDGRGRGVSFDPEVWVQTTVGMVWPRVRPIRFLT